MSWIDNKSWDPTLLLDKRPLIEAHVEPVEPNVRLSTAHETDPMPGEIGWLYQDHGGEA